MKTPRKNHPKPKATSSDKARGGRPTREEAERRRILSAGVDPALVDPRRILAAIALDGATPATARVQACKVLIATSAGSPLVPGVPLADEPAEDEATDELTRRALALMDQRGRPN